jgi:hypothetical protein
MLEAGSVKAVSAVRTAVDILKVSTELLLHIVHMHAAAGVVLSFSSSSDALLHPCSVPRTHIDGHPVAITPHCQCAIMDDRGKCLSTELRARECTSSAGGQAQAVAAVE